MKSKLVRPDGAPVVGQCVAATLRTYPTWLADATGQVLGVTRANTNSTGLWRMDLLPYTGFETADYVYYEVVEGRGMPTWTIRVPPVSDPTTELWLRDLVVVPPDQPEKWCPIDTLGQLHNVAKSVDEALNDDVLIESDGMWIAAPLTIRQLGDVDKDSIATAQPGDVLQLLPNGRWGVSKVTPATLTFVFTPIDPDFNPEVYRFSILTRDKGKTVHVEWGDGYGEDIPFDFDYDDHIYPDCGTYYPEVSYTDHSEVHRDFVDIPCEEIRPMSTPTLMFQPNPARAQSALIRYDGYTKEHIISGGNGKTLKRVAGQTATFDYATPGWYRAEAWAIGGEVLAGIEIRVLDSLHPTFGVFAANPDDADYFQITFADLDGTGIASQVDIDWGDGAAPETVWALPESTAQRALAPGDWDITIVDHGSLRQTTSTQKVIGRVAEPGATIEIDPADASGMTVKVTLTYVDSSKAVTAYWGQEASDEFDQPKAGDVKTHKFAKPGTYLVLVEYTDGSSGDNGTSDFITVPPAEMETTT